jgi:Zn-dependent M28 family amino/carboxypeptidase
MLSVDVAASRGWAVTLSAATANSDYFPFARLGVPAVFPIPGPGAYEGLSADSSQALRGRWDRYHQASDEYHEAFPFEGLQRYAEFALMLVEAIDRRTS